MPSPWWRWNDGFVNIPFALSFDWMVGLFSNLRLRPAATLWRGRDYSLGALRFLLC
jgi:hypothetical protein